MKLSEIKNELKKMLMAFNVVKTDKGVLTYEDEEIVVGTVVKIELEDGTEEIPTGEYVMEDGRTLVIESGEVKEIVDAPEVEPVEVVEPEEAAPEVVEETPAEPEVVEEPVEEAPVAEPEVVEPSEVEVKVAELEGKIAELEAMIAELTSKIEGISMAKPVAEEFENVKMVKKTGFDKVDKFLAGINK